jgi:hypothetical protein
MFSHQSSAALSAPPSPPPHPLLALLSFLQTRFITLSSLSTSECSCTVLYRCFHEQAALTPAAVDVRRIAQDSSQPLVNYFYPHLHVVDPALLN